MRANGRTGVGLGIIGQAQSNALDISEGVRSAVADMAGTLPEGVEVSITSDNATFIDGAIHEVEIALAISVSVVLLIIYVFLLDWRATLIPAAALPVSLIGTVAAIWIAGFSLNILTLLGLVLAAGLVVDDAIVVLENIVRRRNEGMGPRAAAVLGTEEVFFAVLATTATLIAVFVPLSFLPGQTGGLFREFGFVLAISVFLSSIVALSLCPMLASRFLKEHSGHGEEKRGGVLGRVGAPHREPTPASCASASTHDGGGRDLDRLRDSRGHALRHDQVGAHATGGPLARLRPDPGAPGRVDRISRGQIARIEDLIGRSAIPARSGALLDRRQPGLDKQRQHHHVAGAMERAAAEPAADPRRGHAPDPRRPGRARVRVPAEQPRHPRGGLRPAVRGRRQQLCRSRRQRGQDHRRTREGPALPAGAPVGGADQPQLSVTIDRERASDLGIDITGLGNTMQAMLDGREIGSVFIQDRAYDVKLVSTTNPINDPTDLEKHLRPNGRRRFVPMSTIASVREVAVPPSLAREQQLRAVAITSALAGDFALGDAWATAQSIAEPILKPGQRLVPLAETATLGDTQGAMLTTFGFAIVIILLVLAAQFESFIAALIIMATVPLGVACAVFALLLTGTSLNVYSQIGLVLLVGIMAKNGILIVEFANQLRDRGQSVRDAIENAANIRLRPVMMTMICTIVGGLPLVLASGAGGAEARIALGWVIVGGLGLATLSTLFLTPVAYLLLARFTKPGVEEERRLHREVEQAVAQPPSAMPAE